MLCPHSKSYAVTSLGPARTRNAKPGDEVHSLNRYSNFRVAPPILTHCYRKSEYDMLCPPTATNPMVLILNHGDDFLVSLLRSNM